MGSVEHGHLRETQPALNMKILGSSIIALVVLWLADNYWTNGRLADAALIMIRNVARSFGLH
jgi:hypothetical protein